MTEFHHYIIDPDGMVMLWDHRLIHPLSPTFLFRGKHAQIRRLTPRTVWLEWV